MTNSLGARPVITVAGQELSEAYAASVVTIVVDHSLHAPDMFEVHFHDPDRTLVTQAGLHFGAAVTVTATRTAGDGSQERLMVGEITGIEADLTAHGGSRTVVRGYDLSHRLSRGRRTATYRNTTDSAIAQKLAQAANVPIGTVDPTSEVHDHVGQVNVSDWDFLQARAKLLGYTAAVIDGSFVFAKPTQAHEGPASADPESATERRQLVLGESLLSFRPRASSSAQVDSVEVRGWDPKAKQPVVGTASTTADHAQVGVVPGDLTSGYAASIHSLVHHGVTTSDEADAAAAAAAQHVGSAAVEAEGTAIGDPQLRAGTPISVGRAGWPYDGKYTLTTTRHVFGPEGYRTHFTVSGSQKRSMLDLTSSSAAASGGTGSAGKSGHSIFGVAVGVVSDINDPENLGRVKVTLPWLADSYDSNWARCVQLGAGSGRGATFLPEVNDEVLVAFEHGDPQTPFVIGQLWNGSDTPPDAADLVSGGIVAQRELVSRKGHRLLFHEEKGITLEVAEQKAQLVLDSDGGAITISANGDISVTGKAKLSLSLTGDVEVTTQGNLTLNATQKVSITGGTEVDISAPKVGISGSAQVAVSGGVVQIN